jgi:hypothetical protein
MKTSHWIVGLLMVFFSSAATLAYAGEAKEMVSANALKHQKVGISCAACHNTDKPTATAPVSACLKCHSDGKGKFTGPGAKDYAFDGGVRKKVNPHQSHVTDVSCSDCHKTHVPSVNYCNQCHSFSDMPIK